MREMIITTNDKKLSYRALSGAGVKEMQKCVGEEFQLTDVIQGKVQKEDGEEAVLTCLVSDTGDIYQTLSPTVDDNINTLVTVFDIHSEEVLVRISQGQSKNDRNFLQIEVI